ncbi:phospholipase A and acyltransferase 2-like [Boleophthalmus pectinirostris]|uniref:phospholipase A and acyltransferase 2-like n=1 Tax=Boleophthalmus pectinirostris TaxID=150288 RepID=UPI00242E65DF|nr:phospholipase A and acyltransferase 2-like [Boleophthalmus pectinirostris]
MSLLWSWDNLLSTWKQVDKSVDTAAIGDLIEFLQPWSGLSLWAVYVGEGHVMHFGVGDENTTQKACRSLIKILIPKSKSGSILKKTRICTQKISEIRVPPGTTIRVNNNKHNLAPSTLDEILYRCHTFHHQEFNYDMVKFNSEHFATFVRYGQAVGNQISLKPNSKANADTTQTLQMIIQQRAEAGL